MTTTVKDHLNSYRELHGDEAWKSEVTRLAIEKRTNSSLDRIDNNLGYVEGNVRWVDKRINMMRRTLTNDRFKQWCIQIHAHNLP